MKMGHIPCNVSRATTGMAKKLMHTSAVACMGLSSHLLIGRCVTCMSSNCVTVHGLRDFGANSANPGANSSVLENHLGSNW
jgi:hypothetical protein